MNGWPKKSLETVAAVSNSGVWGDEPKQNATDARVVRTSDIDGHGMLRVATLPLRSIPKSRERYLIKAGDILVVKSSGSHTNVVTGKPCFIEEDFGDVAFSNFLLRLRPHPELVEPKFLYFYLRSPSILARVREMVATTTYPNLRVAEYRSFPVPVPPIPEQMRIVSKLDRAFGQLDEITHESAIADADALTQVSRNHRFQRILSTGRCIQFGELVSETRLGLVRSRAEQGEDRMYAYMKMNNIVRGGSTDMTDVTRVDATVEDAELHKLSPGDFVFNTRNSFELVGKTALAPVLPEPLLFNNNLMRVRFRGGISPGYVNHAFQLPSVQRELSLRKSATTNVCAVYYKSLKTLPVPFPETLAEQISISDFLDSVLLEGAKLRAEAEALQTEAAALRKAILREAFAGNL